MPGAQIEWGGGGLANQSKTESEVSPAKFSIICLANGTNRVILELYFINEIELGLCCELSPIHPQPDLIVLLMPGAQLEWGALAKESKTEGGVSPANF